MSARLDGRLAEVLSSFYGVTSGRIEESNYCSVFWEPEKPPFTNIDDILGPLEPVVEEWSDPSPESEEFLRFVSRSARPPSEKWRGYCVKHMELVDHVPRLSSRFCRYVDTLRSCDTLEWELLLELGRTLNTERPMSELPLRARRSLHRRVRNPIIDTSHRVAQLALCTTIIARRQTDSQGDQIGLLCNRRSSSGVSVHGDLYGTLPSGMFSIESGDAESEYSLAHLFYREYLEELFNNEELRNIPSSLGYDFFYDNPDLVYLRKLLADGKALIGVTGLVVSLLNLRPEVCILLYIDDPEWYRRHNRGADGLSRFSPNDEFVRGEVTFVPLDELDRRVGKRRGEWIPSHAAAVELALRQLQTFRRAMNV